MRATNCNTALEMVARFERFNDSFFVPFCYSLSKGSILTHG
jgi:hypothetical protein